ncbi:MAG: IS3 family transposase [bacterium]
MRVYRFIDSQRTVFPTKTLCRVCEVATSSFYAWAGSQAAGPDEATLEEAHLANRIHDIWTRSRYGVPRVTAQLWREGVRVNHKRVARLMCLVGIQGTCGRRRVVTTRCDPSATPAPDLVQRHFDQLALDQLYDITYIPTDEGFCYLAGVLDACSRRMVGWSIAHMRTELVVDALRMAALTRGTDTFEGLIFHSDHGCQYTSGEYRELCAELGITQSMGAVGDSYDNALAESAWASLKRELVYETHFRSIEEARVFVFEWILWYNLSRLHSSLGYQPPVEFEEQLRVRQAA